MISRHGKQETAIREHLEMLKKIFVCLYLIREVLKGWFNNTCDVYVMHFKITGDYNFPQIRLITLKSYYFLINKINVLQLGYDAVFRSEHTK